MLVVLPDTGFVRRLFIEMEIPLFKVLLAAFDLGVLVMVRR